VPSIGSVLRRRVVPADLDAVRAAFDECATHVDLAQRAMLRCVPSSARSVALPLEVGAGTLRAALSDAAAAMPAWRHAAVEPEWQACVAAIDETLAAVDRCVAVAAATRELEVALTAVQDLLDPLHALVGVDERLRALTGSRRRRR
jgi:hypothetical protein